MKNADAITAKLAELKSDMRLTYPPANIQINAPLALCQIEAETKIRTLEWVLGLPFSKFPLPKPKKTRR